MKMGRIRMVAALAAVVMLSVTVGVAQGAKLKNANFEQGDFSHWKTQTSLPANVWDIYTEETREVGGTLLGSGPSRRGVMPGILLPSPRGTYSPFINMGGPGNNVLYRTLKIPARAKTLIVRAFWHNAADFWGFNGSFLSPTSEDQYFSIDLVKPNADPETTEQDKVLEQIFAPGLDGGPPPVPIKAVHPSRGSSATPTDHVSGWKKFTAVDGRGWFRTSDLPRVRRTLSH